VAVSRGAWLAAAAAAAIVVGGAWAGARGRVAAVAAGVAGGTAAALGVLAVTLPAGGVVLRGLLERVRYFAESAGRQHIWRAAWDLFRDHPLTGTGLDTFQVAFADKRTPAYWAIEWNASPARAHNEALNLLATQGALGGVAVLAVVVGALLAVRRALRAGADRGLVVALAAGVAAFAVQDLFSFTVAACGTLVVTQAALLSRLAEPIGTAPARDGLTSHALAVAIVTLVAIPVLALNLSAAPLLDEPARVIGGLLVLLALLAGAAAVFALEQHGRASVLAERARSRPAARTWDRSRVALAVRWAIGAILLAGLVVRPFAAARAAYRGVLLTPDAPAAAVRSLEQAVALEPFTELYWVKLGAAAHALARASDQAEARRQALERARTAYERAARLVPANSYDHANLGRVLADLARDGATRPATALAAFDRALAMDPNNAYFYVDAANAALAMDDVDHAQAYAARGAALYPRFAIPRAQLGGGRRAPASGARRGVVRCRARTRRRGVESGGGLAAARETGRGHRGGAAGPVARPEHRGGAVQPRQGARGAGPARRGDRRVPAAAAAASRLRAGAQLTARAGSLLALCAQPPSRHTRPTGGSPPSVNCGRAKWSARSWKTTFTRAPIATRASASGDRSSFTRLAMMRSASSGVGRPRCSSSSTSTTG